MSRPTSITIVVVTYHNDFTLLERFLNSVYEFWNPEQIDKIIIIFNDKIRYRPTFDALIKKYTKLKFKLQSIYPEDLEPKMEFFDWHSQQLLKCLISKEITTDWYLVNDCKDFYTRPVDMDSMFDNQGKAIMQLDHQRYPNEPTVPPGPSSYWTPGPFSLALSVSYEIFDLDPQDHKLIHFPTTTPFIIKTEIMQGMVSELKGMMKGFFHYLFSVYLDGQCLVTEFLLYSAYCYKTTNYRDYVDWDINHRDFFISVSQSKDLRTYDVQDNTGRCNVEE